MDGFLFLCYTVNNSFFNLGEQTLKRNNQKFIAMLLLCFLLCNLAMVPVYAEEGVNLSGYAFATGNNYESENRIPMYAIDGVRY